MPRLREVLPEIRKQSRPFVLVTTLEGGTEDPGARRILFDDPGVASEIPHTCELPSGEFLLLEPLQPGRLATEIPLLTGPADTREGRA